MILLSIIVAFNMLCCYFDFLVSKCWMMDVKKIESKHQHSEMKYFGPKVNKTILKSSTEKYFVKFAQQKFSENLKVVQPRPAHHSPPPLPEPLSYQQTIF